MATAQRPTAVATRPEPAHQVSVLDRDELKALTSSRARAFIEAQLSGSGVTFERFMAEVLGAILENPKLLECEPFSLVKAAARIGSWGLTIGEKAYLIPYKGKAKAVRDYKGDAELVINAGGARFIDQFNFYENEPFGHSQGSNPFIKHTPLSPSRRGALIGSYAIAVISANLPPKIKLMWNEEIDAIRLKHSHEWKNGTLEELPGHFYGPKTCVKQLCKLLPTNPRMEKVKAMLDAEDAEFEIVDERLGAAAAEPARDISHMQEAEDDEEPFPAKAQAPTPAAKTAPTTMTEPASVKCPKCGGVDLYDNRAENVKRRAAGQKQRPDWKCKDEACGGLLWPPRDSSDQMKF